MTDYCQQNALSKTTSVNYRSSFLIGFGCWSYSTVSLYSLTFR
ncbi:hypothetical protein [Pseudoalteromonas porphyrae]